MFFFQFGCGLEKCDFRGTRVVRGLGRSCAGLLALGGPLRVASADGRDVLRAPGRTREKSLRAHGRTREKRTPTGKKKAYTHISSGVPPSR